MAVNGFEDRAGHQTRFASIQDHTLASIRFSIIISKRFCRNIGGKMNSTVGSKDLKKIGKESGADLVGICDAAMLKEADPAADAENFLKGARAVVIALVADPPYIEHADDPFVYSRLAFPGYLKADGAVASMRAALEDEGFMTCRVERESTHAFDRKGRLSKTLPMKKAAELAGLGAIGMNQLLVTPEYGPRVRMSAFITDAPLAADKPIGAQICDSCGACVKNCPSGALAGDNSFDFAVCSAYMFGGLDLRGLRGGFPIDPIDAVKSNFGKIGNAASGWFASLSEGRRLFYYCGNCVRLCNGHKRYLKANGRSKK